jgi:dethiobiotin synthetase
MPSPVAHSSKLQRPIVVTGTGTGVGKTFVSAEWLALLVARGERCLGLKPIETGFQDPATSDAATLAHAAGHSLIAPYFAAPQPESPHRAARSLRTPIDVNAVAEWVATQVTRWNPDVVLVETAGGLFSPLSQTALNVDIVRALEPCTFVLVAADRLGALHDVLSAVTAARSVHRTPDLICMNLHDDATALRLDNAAELRRIVANVPVIQAPLLRFQGAAELAALL